MNQKEFKKLLDRRIELTKNVLDAKNKEYASDNDKLHNFKRAADMLQCSPEKALVGMWTKHIISILDIIDNLDYKCKTEKQCFPAFNTDAFMEMIDEKFGDAINYLILLEALVRERYDRVCS